MKKDIEYYEKVVTTNIRNVDDEILPRLKLLVGNIVKIK